MIYFMKEYIKYIIIWGSIIISIWLIGMFYYSLEQDKTLKEYQTKRQEYCYKIYKWGEYNAGAVRINKYENWQYNRNTDRCILTNSFNENEFH